MPLFDMYHKHNGQPLHDLIGVKYLSKDNVDHMPGPNPNTEPCVNIFALTTLVLHPIISPVFGIHNRLIS